MADCSSWSAVLAWLVKAPGSLPVSSPDLVELLICSCGSPRPAGLPAAGTAPYLPAGRWSMSACSPRPRHTPASRKTRRRRWPPRPSRAARRGYRAPTDRISTGSRLHAGRDLAFAVYITRLGRRRLDRLRPDKPARLPATVRRRTWRLSIELTDAGTGGLTTPMLWLAALLDANGMPAKIHVLTPDIVLPDDQNAQRAVTALAAMVNRWWTQQHRTPPTMEPATRRNQINDADELQIL